MKQLPRAGGCSVIAVAGAIPLRLRPLVVLPQAPKRPLYLRERGGPEATKFHQILQTMGGRPWWGNFSGDYKLKPGFFEKDRNLAPTPWILKYASKIVEKSRKSTIFDDFRRFFRKLAKFSKISIIFRKIIDPPSRGCPLEGH